MAAPSPTPAAAARPARPKPKPNIVERVVIRSLPEVVFLYPTMVVAALCSLMVWQGWGSDSLWGHIFLIVFGLNMIVVAFDFPRTTSLTILFLAIAVILGAILLNDRKEFFPALQRQTAKLHPAAEAQFYFIVALILAVVMLVVFIIHTWFDYWEVSSNELIHHHGILGSLRTSALAQHQARQGDHRRLRVFPAWRRDACDHADRRGPPNRAAQRAAHRAGRKPDQAGPRRHRRPDPPLTRQARAGSVLDAPPPPEREEPPCPTGGSLRRLG